MVEVKELNEENWYKCCEINVSKEQEEFLISNAVSIAHSKYEPSLKTVAIYFEGEVVGFAMYNTIKEELDSYWIWRIMVDERFQGQGIGEEATRLIIKDMKGFKECRRIAVAYVGGNEGAAKLYKKLGFVDGGDRFGREVAVVLEVK